MDKRDLAAIVANKTGIARADCELVISKTFESIKEANVRREKVTIRGFGTFGFKQYKEPQTFVQPRDKSTYVLPPRVLPAFSPVDGYVKAVKNSKIDQSTSR